MSGQRIEKTPKGEHKKGRKGAVLAGVAAAVVLCGYLGLCAWAGGRDAIPLWPSSSARTAPCPSSATA